MLPPSCVTVGMLCLGCYAVLVLNHKILHVALKVLFFSPTSLPNWVNFKPEYLFISFRVRFRKFVTNNCPLNMFSFTVASLEMQQASLCVGHIKYIKCRGWTDNLKSYNFFLLCTLTFTAGFTAQTGKISNENIPCL